MNNEERNIENLHIHIEGLQATLTKRNERIAQLEAKVETLTNNPVAGAAEKKAYKKGWQDAASHLQDTAKTAARALAEINKDAFRIWLDGDKK